jgi:HEAT repeat protein
MSEQVTNELKKLSAIATDMDLSSNLRTNAVKSMGNIGTHEALLTLLELVANEKLNPNERELALKQAKNIIKSAR